MEVQETMSAPRFKCLDCPCLFYTQKDLTRHLETFSYYPEAHRKNWAKEMERRQKYE